MSDAATHIKNAREELKQARRDINGPGEQATRTDYTIGRIEGVLCDLQPIVEVVQDDDTR